jgi:hypothetical protein
VIVVARYNALYIRHAAIAKFNCVTVEYFVQRTCRWEVFIEKLQEIPRDVGSNGFAERGVEPDTVSLAPSFLRCGGEGLLVEYSKETL